MKIKTIVAVFSLLLMVGCKSTVGANYTYVPKELSQTVIDELKHKFPSKLYDDNTRIEMRFFEHESYIEMEKIAESGFVFGGGDLKHDIYDMLCGNENDEFVDFIRKNGLGVKYILTDEKMMREAGPWNTDICNIPT